MPKPASTIRQTFNRAGRLRWAVRATWALWMIHGLMAVCLYVSVTKNPSSAWIDQLFWASRHKPLLRVVAIWLISSVLLTFSASIIPSAKGKRDPIYKQHRLWLIAGWMMGISGLLLIDATRMMVCLKILFKLWLD